MNDFSHLSSRSTSLRPVHARRVWTEPALCGDVGPSQYATERAYVTCRGCREEIERRVAARGRR